MNKIEQLNTMKYIATTFYYDGPVEIVLHDEKFDNYYLCMISCTKENMYACFSGEKEDFGSMLIGSISQNDFLRKSNCKFYVVINSIKDNVANITFKEYLTNLDSHLYYDDIPFIYAESVDKLPLDAFLKYTNFKISGKGLYEFISYFNESV